MIFMKVKGSKSWLDPQSNRSLAANLSARLWQRCQGHRGVFVTLTYRREEYADALDLYRTQSEQQHVPLFLRKVSRYLGQSLKGRWLCKLEFQKGGWVHWHIIILDVERIEHARLTAMWDRGHVWIHRLNEKRIRYCCKYVSKGGGIPAWLYGERPKSVKVVRVSPGFWGDTPEVSTPDDTEDEYERRQPQPKRYPFWKTIGRRIEECRSTVVMHDGEGHYRTTTADYATIVVRLFERGHGVIGSDRGWLVLDAGWRDVQAALPPMSTRDALRGAVPHGGGAALHLTEVRNPDATGRIGGWLRALLEERLTHHWPESGGSAVAS